MKKIKDLKENTIIIDKSRFITNVFPVSCVEEVNENLAAIRKKYYDSTHVCYAYILDDGNIQKCSDDGEPAKTAGYPMLDVLKKQEITNILVTTTRYFGGIKLGAGGLVRAYSSSVSEALIGIDFYETKKLSIYELKLDYSEYNRLLDFISKEKILNTTFLSDVVIEIAFYDEELEEKLLDIKNKTFGKDCIHFIKTEYTDIKI